MSNRQTNPTNSLSKLINIISKLRCPTNGSDWCNRQNHQTLIPYLLEEAHEVASAIQDEDYDNLKEELGDLLFQIIFHSQIASEKNIFYLDNVITALNEKLIRRNADVFEIESNKNKSWEEIKKDECNKSKVENSLSAKLKKLLKSQSAIAGAIRISEEVAKEGFDWNSVDEVWDKINEELDELKFALQERNLNNAKEELGDVFFSLINLGRWYGLNAEEGLALTNNKFLTRFKYIEDNSNKDISICNLQEMQNLWKEAKQNL